MLGVAGGAAVSDDAIDLVDFDPSQIGLPDGDGQAVISSSVQRQDSPARRQKSSQGNQLSDFTQHLPVSMDISERLLHAHIHVHNQYFDDDRRVFEKIKEVYSGVQSICKGSWARWKIRAATGIKFVKVSRLVAGIINE